jgi:hypothetical protein
LQAEAEDHAKFVVTATALAYLLPAMKINPLPAGFVVPAQPVLASKPPSGADWVHEIKHDGYRMIVRRDSSSVRLYSRNAYDWTARLSAIAATAELIKAKSFTIDGEAVVLGPDGLSRFEELVRARGGSMSDPSRTIYLVSCVSEKSPMPAQAKDLYKSDWFLKARDYVESTRSPWFILSAKYGLVPPDRILAPYELTLNKMRKSDRQKWATMVEAEMEISLPAVDRIVLLAGARYREFLMDYLRRRVAMVEVPMEGLSIGRQLHYLTGALYHERV